MIELRTLGLLDLKSADGQEIRTVLTQPKRVALLAYLAFARPQGFHRRDTLLGLLWPDSDHAHARAALRKAVFMLREALGEGVVVNRGDEELGIDVKRLWCDAVAFEQAVGEGRRSEALELYRGDILPGLYISGALEFERWLERERARFRDVAARAAWALTEEAESQGDDIAALQRARRGLLLSPDDEGAVRRMIGLLDRVGDRAGALHVYEEFASQLAEDYAAEPSAETNALIEEVRQRVRRISGERPARRPAPPPPPEAAALTVRTGPGRRRPWRGLAIAAVAVMASAWGASQLLLSRSRPVIAVGSIRDFSSADTSAVARALPLLLATNLARLPGIQVISGARLYEIQGQLDTGSAAARSPTVTSAAARRAGATELLELELYRLPAGGLRLDLRRVRLANGQVIGSYTAEGDDPFALVDAITTEVALAAGVPPSGLRVADVTTSSFQAFQLYEEGLRAYSRGDWPSAYRLFRAALMEDSSFAMGAYYAALSGFHEFDNTGSNRYLDQALRYAHRATERERLLIQASSADLRSEPNARALAETLVARYPSEPDAHDLVGRALMWTGRFLEAVPHFRRVIQMDSLSLGGSRARCLACDGLDYTVRAYVLADSFPAAERTAHEWVRLQPRSPRAWFLLSFIYSDQHRLADALAARRTAVELGATGPEEEVQAAACFLREGAFGAADSVLAGLLTSATPAVRQTALWFRTISLRYQGRLREALDAARRFRRQSATARTEPPPIEWMPEAQVLFEQGRHRAAAALFDSLAGVPSEHASPGWTARMRSWMLAHAAMAHAAAGDTGTLGSLADSVETWSQQTLLSQRRQLPFHVRGLLAIARGQPEEAARLFRRAVFSLSHGYGRTNLELGRMLVILGRPTEAISVLRPATQGPLEAGNFYVTQTELHLLLGRAFEAAGQPDSAAAHYRWVLNAWKRADPEFTARRDSVRARLTTLGRT